MVVERTYPSDASRLEGDRSSAVSDLGFSRPAITVARRRPGNRFADGTVNGRLYSATARRTHSQGLGAYLEFPNQVIEEVVLPPSL